MDSCRPKTPSDIQLPMQRSSRRTAHEEPVTSSGHVTFDDRGQAVWKWERPPQPAPDNPAGGRNGYDPYGRERPGRSGKSRPARKDLRKLDEWIRLRKQAQQNGREP